MPRHSKKPRFSAMERCAIGRQDGSVDHGKLVDLSKEGFCVDGSRPFDLHERIEIRTIGLGRLSGIVRWCDGHRAGGVLEPYSRGAFD